jgi:3-hydroxybutyrate dehydrogenase
MTTDLTDKWALVTGGAGGIGLACVRALSAAGAKVHVVDLDAEGAERAAAEAGGRAHAADLTDPAAIEALPDDVDILVNNAGVQHVAPLTEFPPERFTRMQALMVTAPFLLIRRSLPAMYARRWGRIVNMSSVHGLRASAYKSAYVAAKHGHERLSKVTALEGAQFGVTSNCVNPGYVRTPSSKGRSPR